MENQHSIEIIDFQGKIESVTAEVKKQLKKKQLRTEENIMEILSEHRALQYKGYALTYVFLANHGVPKLHLRMAPGCQMTYL